MTNSNTENNITNTNYSNSFLRSVVLVTPTFHIIGIYLLKLIQVHGSVKKVGVFIGDWSIGY